jgi:predicted RNase H-like HicB family nuclease
LASSDRSYDLATKRVTLPIIIQADADGCFVSFPALQGCYSQGDTYEEAVENVKDASLHIGDRLADGEEMPENVSVSLSLASKSLSDALASAAHCPRDNRSAREGGVFSRAAKRQLHDLQEREW